MPPLFVNRSFFGQCFEGLIPFDRLKCDEMSIV